jgi:hypothetical protein
MNFSERDVISLFHEHEEDLLDGIKSHPEPVAIILGGQPATGKSALISCVKSAFPGRDFLIVNGDSYRLYHPEGDTIIRCDLRHYSERTQIFSNIFTEQLIALAVEDKFNIIVEGTMRNPDVPMKTARVFRGNGFQVHAYVIAAYPLISALGVYRRYEEEASRMGVGRLSDMNAHNAAARGLLDSVDRLYAEKAVDSIQIYSYLAQTQVRSINISNGKWDTGTCPSFYINRERGLQKMNRELISHHIELGQQTLKTIDPSLRLEVATIIDKLSSLLKTNNRDLEM